MADHKFALGDRIAWQPWPIQVNAQTRLTGRVTRIVPDFWGDPESEPEDGYEITWDAERPKLVYPARYLVHLD
jgi:hypothetical protein